MTETFLRGDYRGELREFLKGFAFLSGRLVKAASARYGLYEELSLDLVRRKLFGLKGSRVKKEILECGKRGECQEHKETKERRFRGYYCNHRAYHIPCAIRYRNGQGIEMKSQYLEIAKALNLWGFYYWIFTLPDSVRAWIDNHSDQRKAFLEDVRRSIATTMRGALGIGPKSRNVQPGFSIMYHPVSSSNPFKQSSHFHVIALPVTANLRAKKLALQETRFDHRRLKSNYKQNLDKVLTKYGLSELSQPIYDVRLRDVEVWSEAEINHVFKYNNRSQAEDLFKIIKRVSDDFEYFVCVRKDRRNDCLIPELKRKEEILDALELALHPVIQSRMSYGFMRTIEKYSDLLSIEKHESEDDQQWQKLYEIDILRQTRNLFIDGKVKTVLLVMVRRSNSDEEFQLIKPGELRGERSLMTDRTIWKARK